MIVSRVGIDHYQPSLLHGDDVTTDLRHGGVTRPGAAADD